MQKSDRLVASLKSKNSLNAENDFFFHMIVYLNSPKRELSRQVSLGENGETSKELSFGRVQFGGRKKNAFV